MSSTLILVAAALARLLPPLKLLFLLRVLTAGLAGNPRCVRLVGLARLGVLDTKPPFTLDVADCQVEWWLRDPLLAMDEGCCGPWVTSSFLWVVADATLVTLSSLAFSISMV